MLRIVIREFLTMSKLSLHPCLTHKSAEYTSIRNRYPMNAYTAPSTRPLYRGTQAVWYILAIIEVLLAFRFILRLLAANPAAGFTDLIYTLSYPFVAPFMAVFSTTRVAASAFEWTTLLAMAVYWLLAIGIIRLLTMSKSVSTQEAAYKLERQS